MTKNIIIVNVFILKFIFSFAFGIQEPNWSAILAKIDRKMKERKQTTSYPVRALTVGGINFLELAQSYSGIFCALNAI